MLIALISSCQQKRQDTTAKIQTETVDTTIYLVDTKPSPSFHISLTYDYLVPHSANDTVTERINQAIIHFLLPKSAEGVKPELLAKNYIESAYENYRSDVYSIYMADSKNHNFTTEDLPAWYNYNIDCSLKLWEGRPGIYNCRQTLYMDTGGAHPNTMFTTLNIDRNTGKVLNHDDIFVPNTDPSIAKAILPYLIKETNRRLETDTITSINGLRENGVLLDGDLTVSRQFLLEKDSITFIYNAYEIAPYVMGTFELSIPYTDIQRYLKLK